MQITNNREQAIKIVFFERQPKPNSAETEIVRSEEPDPVTGDHEPVTQEIDLEQGKTVSIGINLQRLVVDDEGAQLTMREVELRTTDGVVAAFGNGTRVIDGGSGGEGPG